MEVQPARIRIHSAAHRHGVSDADILHAYRNATDLHYLDDGAVMLVGPQRDGSRIEVAVRYHPHQQGVVIFHAMRARRKYLR